MNLTFAEKPITSALIAIMIKIHPKLVSFDDKFTTNLGEDVRNVEALMKACMPEKYVRYIYFFQRKSK